MAANSNVLRSLESTLKLEDLKLMAPIQSIPLEIIEQIVLELHPLDVAFFAQTCAVFYHAIYHSGQHLWRSLYLALPLDDPRKCISPIGEKISEVNWKSRVQRVMRARTVVVKALGCPEEQRIAVLHTLLELACNTTPMPLFSEEVSLNLVWLVTILGTGSFFSTPAWPLSKEEHQLRARLHVHFGVAEPDWRKGARTVSRSFVYAMRHYRSDNDFGPFMDNSGRVNWEHVQAIHHVMSMHLLPTGGTEPAYMIFPMSMPYCQPVLAEGTDLDKLDDWAGVAGLWRCSFAFCDHRELLVYNNYNISPTDPLHSEIFDDPDFIEVFRSMHININLISTEPDPCHPRRPKINFAGNINQHATVVGWVAVTSDNQIRWHYVIGDQGNAMWSCEGVQVGGVRSTYGVLGSWTTVHHDLHDPVGPWWLRKIKDHDD